MSLRPIRSRIVQTNCSSQLGEGTILAQRHFYILCVFAFDRGTSGMQARWHLKIYSGLRCARLRSLKVLLLLGQGWATIGFLEVPQLPENHRPDKCELIRQHRRRTREYRGFTLLSGGKVKRSWCWKLHRTRQHSCWRRKCKGKHLKR